MSEKNNGIKKRLQNFDRAKYEENVLKSLKRANAEINKPRIGYKKQDRGEE